MEIKILLSTYNGEKYLEQQLDSLIKLRHDELKIKIVVRDDGSMDGTSEILHKYEKMYPELFCIYFEDNIGWMNSFAKLIHLAGEADYYAFCDQDDIWKDDKIIHAIELISNINGPVLYCGTAEMVDDNMKTIGYFNCLHEYDFERTIIKCQTLGCTQVFNKKLYDYVCRINTMRDIPHDWWTLCVALLCGTVVSDEQSFIFYRQHKTNVFGGNGDIIKRIKRIWGDNTHKRVRLCNELIDSLDIRDNEFMNSMANYIEKKECKRFLLRKNYNNVPFAYRIWARVFIFLGKI